jgi:predicted aminopeptidase
MALRSPSARCASAALWAGLLALPFATGGCYLAHVASGQVRLLCARVPVEQVLDSPDASPALRSQLERVEEARRYAKRLGLAVGDRYTQYAEWPGDSVVTTVVATRPGEVEPVTTWFPIVGSVPYRGYFDPARADAEAARLRAQHLDVCESKVRAYSTLGWFDDPLTGPMVREDEATLVETIFHELLHATVFVSSEPEFNEGVAAFFGQEARVRFYSDREGPARGERERQIVEANRRLRSEILVLRRAVEALYASEPAGPARDERRAALEADARARIARLDLLGRDSTALAADLELGDACLAISGTYHEDNSRLAAVLAGLGGDLSAFLARVQQAAQASDPRAALLGEVPAGP